MYEIRSRQGRLPVPPTALIGRDADIETVERLLEAHRLVTLTGAGGSGKTRLAVAVGTALADRFRDGAVFVGLQDRRSQAEVAAAVAVALGLHERADAEPEERVVAYLSARESLLILDNFEQVLSASPLVSGLIEAAPDVRVLVTSRAPLRIAGEQEREVLPLSDEAAIALFNDRAMAVRPDFDPVPHEEVIEAVTRRVDGLPLALELAAGQVRILTPEAILERLESSLPVLETSRRDAPERQRTQRATLDWSLGLLDPAARRLFQVLSVFAGGWTLEAAERVCGALEGSPVDVFAGLGTLVEHNLVRMMGTDGPEPRYSMLQVTREHAVDLLADAPDRPAIERRHATWVRDLVEAAEPELVRRDLKSWQGRLRREEDNLRAALRWTIDHEEVELGERIAGSLWRFWHHWGGAREGIAWLEAVVDRSDVETPSEPRARALSSLAALWWHQGRSAESLRLYLEVIGILRALGYDDHRMGDAVDDASWAAALNGDEELAMRLTDEKWDYPRVKRSVRMDGWAEPQELRACREYVWQGDESAYDRCIAWLEPVIGELRRSDQALLEAYATSNVASVHFMAGQFEMALGRGREVLRLYIELGHFGLLASSLRRLAACELALGRPERAVRLDSAARQLATELGGFVDHRGGLLRPFGDVTVEARSMLPASAFARGIEEGRAMSVDEAVAFALSKTSRPHRPATRGKRDRRSLSPREMEVLDLLADGRTDGEIADALFISKKTASVHVAHIKGKLGAATRAEIVAMAIRGGLVRSSA